MENEILHEIKNLCHPGEQLCLLPISRINIESPQWINEKRFAVFPPYSIDPQSIRVMEWPERTFDMIMRNSRDGYVSVEGSDLAWLQSGSTKITLDEFFRQSLIACTTQVSWEDFLSPRDHQVHIGAIRSAMTKCEEILDIIRFERCNLWLPEKLPGRAGLLDDSPFCAGLFYAPEDHEAYIVAGQIATHRIIVGVGLDLEGVTANSIGNGQLGKLARHALRLYTSALEADSETSRFVQIMSIIEFLADPDSYTKMADAKKAIARQIAKSRNEYESILSDFFYLSAEKGNPQYNKGLRHNIVHLGKQLEDLTTKEERMSVFRRLSRYVGVPIQQMIQNSECGWSKILEIREKSKTVIGV
jgi:hypothetical protein